MIVQGTSVGLDVHALSVVVHAVDEETGRVKQAWLCPDHGEIVAWLHQLRGPVRVAYEAGPTGYGLHRQIKGLGFECAVVAPSLIPKRRGDKVKTNRRDALSLAKLLRAEELTAVWVPDGHHEAMRDLTRARETAMLDLRTKR